jgi:hypothetical protein
MRAEFRWVETDARHPFLHEPSVLSCRQSAFVATTGEEEVAGLPSGQSQVVVDSLSRLVGELEPDRPARLLLTDGGAIHGITTRGHILDADGDHVAAAQLAVDCQIEESEIPLLTLHLQLGSDRPDVAGTQRRLRADEFPLVPGYASGLVTGGCRFLFHGLSPSLRERPACTDADLRN